MRQHQQQHRHRLGCLASHLASNHTAHKEGRGLPQYTLEEVARHDNRDSCWVAIRGHVFDFTSFVDEHPGGGRGLLRHAGTDASEVFAELHTQSIFAEFGPRYRIGTIAHDGRQEQQQTGWTGVSAVSRGWEGLPGALSDVDPACTAVSSPFPHDAYTGTGCESFRFLWTIADRLLRVDENLSRAAVSVPPRDRLASSHIHRQKSNLGVLHVERDWLHVGEPKVYAAEMSLKHALYRDHRPKVYVTTVDSVSAEQEVLELVLDWLARRYPKRFRMSTVDGSEYAAGTGGHAVASVETLTPGYRHTFLPRDDEWAKQPLVLVGMLVQEDFYLLDERAADAPSPRAVS